MGLIITNEIYADAGKTSAAYIHISKFQIFRGNGADTSINLYLDKSTRDANVNDTMSSKSIPTRMRISQEDLDLTNVYLCLYSNLKTLLEGRGFTVEDDI